MLVGFCLCRSGLEPVGGFTPDRNAPPLPNTCPKLQNPSSSSEKPVKLPRTPVRFCRCRSFWSRSGVQPPTSTRPERSTLAKPLPKTPKPVKLFRKTRQAPPNTGQILPLPVGLEPVGGCTPDRNDPPPPNISMRFRIRRPANKLISIFYPLFLCFRVDGSFRSGVQPPTGTRPERSTPAKYFHATPNP